MKKTIIIFLTLMCFIVNVCGCKNNDEKIGINELIESASAIYETHPADAFNNVKELVDRNTEFSQKIDAKKKFRCTLPDEYMKVITEDMVKMSSEYFDDESVVEVPTPHIVQIDDSDENDVKYFGDFYINGYELRGTVFYTKNGGSFPGCYHLKKSGNKVTLVSKEFAEDGSNNWSSLVKICGGDEELAKRITNKDEEESEYLQALYAKMYAKGNGIKLSGIKDYGWPIKLFNDISNAEFAYNFYNSYFEEVKDYDLNDLEDRLTSLKNKYFTPDLIAKVDKLTSERDADMVINAQDVTDTMVNTLKAEDIGGGVVVISCDHGDGVISSCKVTVDVILDEKKISDIVYE